MHRKWIEPVVLLLIAAIALWDGQMIIVTRQETLGAREAGGWVALLGLCLACMALLYGALLSQKPELGGQWELGRNVRLPLTALAMLGGYIFLMDRLGYLLSTALFFALYLRLYGSFRWAPILVGSFAVALMSTYTWALLGMMLPTGILPWP